MGAMLTRLRERLARLRKGERGDAGERALKRKEAAARRLEHERLDNKYPRCMGRTVHLARTRGDLIASEYLSGLSSDNSTLHAVGSTVRDRTVRGRALKRENPGGPGSGRVGDPGFEPGTSSLSEKRSNRLS